MADTSAAAAANDLRLRGNHEFSQGHFDHAKALYTAALEECTAKTTPGAAVAKDNDQHQHQHRDEAVILYCNRSACCYQLGDYEGSLEDAERAWQLSVQTSTKAAFRLAKSALALRQYALVKSTVAAALRILQDQELIIAIDPSLKAMPDRRVEKKNVSPQEVATAGGPTASVEDIAQQRASFQGLLQSAAQAEQQPVEGPETSIVHATRPVSIREFETIRELGHGNFSEIYHVRHKVTLEVFALKKINKKAAADLYKRQHPNVYNEIQMERRCLLERIRNVPYVVPMYHAFQDYENLYYLMQLQQTDLWSQLRYKNLPGYGETVGAPYESLIMMGCHRSPAKRWLRQVVDALESIHRLGIVHRT
jgi:tetratricopeptide (TPR) repeat protein